MQYEIQCGGCGSRHLISDNQLGNRPGRLVCKACQGVMVISPGPGGVTVEGGTLQSPFDHSLPPRLGAYSDLKRIASGGMGDIYLAKQEGAEGFEREVVLKVLHAHLAREESFTQVLADEAKLTVRLQHPNIVQMYDLERAGALLYCVMEYVPGESLASILRTYYRKGGVLPLEMSVYIVSEVLQGLAYAHGKTSSEGEPLGLVHRDVSPQNILVTPEGWVKLIDFGIAKAAQRSSHTAPGKIKGKFAYMAPEQLLGTADHRADLFATGVVLWECLAGVRLFHASTDADTLQKLMHMEPPPISLTRIQIPREMDRILERALAKDPDKRYQSAQEFRSDLLAFAAPANVDQLRAAVDIRAGGLEDAGPAAAGMTEVGRDEDTPVVEPPAAFKRYLASRRGRQAPGTWHRVVLAALGLAGLVVLAVAAVLWLPGLVGGGPESSGSGPGHGADIVEPARQQPPATGNDGGSADAGATGTLRVAGSDAHGHDATTVAGCGDMMPDAGTGALTDRKRGKKKRGVLAGAVRRESRNPIKLTRRLVGRVLRRHGARLQKCADRHLAGRGQDALSLTLEFTVGRKGTVTAASLLPTAIESSAFGRCLLGRIRAISFPPHRDRSVSVAFPLSFQALRKSQ